MLLSGHSSEIYDYDAELKAQRRSVVEDRSPVMPFVFAPYSLALFAPLAILPYSYAVLLWYGVNVALLVAVPLLLRHRLNMNSNHVAFAVISMGLFYPITTALAQGQLMPLTPFLFTLVFLSLEQGRDFRAGCLLAVAVYKPQFVVPLLLVLAFLSHWRAVRGFCLCCVGLFGVSVALAGWRSTMRFPQAMIRFAKSPVNLAGC